MISASYVSAALAAIRLAAASLLLTALAGAATAQGFSTTSAPGGAPIAAEEAFRLEVTERNDNSRLLSWEIEEGYYLYRDHLAAMTEDGASLPLETEPGMVKEDPTFGAIEVYYDTAQVVPPAAAGPVELIYQGCQDGGICYPPQTVTLAAAEGGLPVPAEAPAADAVPAARAAGVTLANDAGLLDSLSARGGPALVLGAFLLFGLLLAFTPCVFPMFPILACILAGQGGSLTARRGATLSLAYVLAMASAFWLLGVAAAWSAPRARPCSTTWAPSARPR